MFTDIVLISLPSATHRGSHPFSSIIILPDGAGFPALLPFT